MFPIGNVGPGRTVRGVSSSDEIPVSPDLAERWLREAWHTREVAPERLRARNDAVKQRFPQLAEAGEAPVFVTAFIWLIDAYLASFTGQHEVTLREANRAMAAFVALGDEAFVAWTELTLGTAAFFSSRPEEARRRAEEARDIFRRLGNARGEAGATSAAGNVWRVTGDLAKALTCSREALALFQSCQHQPGIAAVLNNLGAIAHSLGDYTQAAVYFEQSLKLAREIGYRRIATYSLNNIGTVCEANEDFENALTWHHESLAMKQEVGDRRGQAISLNNIGLVLKKLGRPDEALGYQGRALTIFTELDDRWGQSYVHQGFGDLAKDAGDLPKARHHFAEALRLRGDVGDRILEGEAMCLLGEVLLRLPAEEGSGERALALGADALAIGVEKKALPLQILAHKLLHQARKASGDLARALEHCEQTVELERQLARRESDEKLKNLRVLRDVEATQRKLETEQDRSRELTAALDEASRQHDRAVAAHAAKSEVLRVVAHDLRNPVAAIRSLSDLLAAEVERGGEAEEFVSLIASSADSVLQLVGNLMQSATIEAGRLEPQRVPVDLSALLQREARVVAAPARAKRQQLETDIAPGLAVSGDPDLLGTVFSNLLTNAVKYSPEGRTIWLKAARRDAAEQDDQSEKTGKTDAAGREIEVTLRDEGVGLTAEDLTRMFGQFTRLSARPTGGEGSTGLGLYIVHQLVGLHDGRVWAESPGPGLGSTFHVVLPAASGPLSA